MESESPPTAEEIQEVSIPGTYMTKRYEKSNDTWIYSLRLECSAPVSNEMLYSAISDTEKRIYQKMLHKAIGVCHQELENSK